MAITLVTPGASAAATAFSTPLTTAVSETPFTFGDLLSLQISGLSFPLVTPADMPPPRALREGEELMTPDPENPLSLADPAQLLAGLLAAPVQSPVATAPTTDPVLNETGLAPESILSTTKFMPSNSIDSPPNRRSDSSPLLLANSPGSVKQPVTESTTPAGAVLPTDPLSILKPASGLAANLAAEAANGSERGSIQPDFATTALAVQSTVQSQHKPHSAHEALPHLATPVHDKNWAQGFGERVVWMSKNDLHSAQLNITPPELGPVQIQLKLHGDQATAAFASPHAEVRQAIEEALPRLRELLANSGIELGQANVGAQMAQQERGNQGQTPDSPRFSSDKAILHADGSLADAHPVKAGGGGQGMVDLFA